MGHQICNAAELRDIWSTLRFGRLVVRGHKYQRMQHQWFLDYLHFLRPNGRIIYTDVRTICSPWKSGSKRKEYFWPKTIIKTWRPGNAVLPRPGRWICSATYLWPLHCRTRLPVSMCFVSWYLIRQCRSQRSQRGGTANGIFKTADPNDMSQGDLSRRVHFLKSEEGGYQVMCEISEKWYREGEEHGKIEGEKSQARRTALELRKMGLSVDMIARAVNFSLDTVKQWLAEGVFPAK